MRPGAVRRALREIAAHRDFETWCVPPEVPNEGPSSAVFEFSVDMSPGWASAGESPSGVRPSEQVTVTFAPDYPNSAPVFRLRQDFPRNFPHLQPGPMEQAPRPCLVLGSETNLFRRFGIGGMLAQLARWLHAAAHDRLNSDDSVWEPARRDQVHDNLIANLRGLHALPAGRHEWAYRWVAYTSLFVGDGNRVHQVTLTEHEVKLTEKFWNGVGYKDLGHGFCQGKSLGVILKPAKNSAGEAFVADQYQPDTVHDIATLRDALQNWHCSEAFESLLHSINQHLGSNRRKDAFRVIPVVILVNLPRPRPVSGAGSNIETMAYLLELDLRRGQPIVGQTNVRLAAVIEQTGPALLRRFNQELPDVATRKWASIGCGSLGSKIALQAARQGRAPSVLIDPEFLEPHNYARYAVTPMSSDLPNQAPIPKVHAIDIAISQLQQSTTPKLSAIEPLLADRKQHAQLIRQAEWLWVNTTASVAVRNALTLAEDKNEIPGVLEGALFGAGRVGYLAMTGSAHNPNSSELFAQSIWHFGEDTEIADAALSIDTQFATIQTGMGCGSETMPVSDATITQHASAMTTAFLGMHEGGLPEAGRLWIGKQSQDRLGIDWSVFDVLPFQRVALRQGTEAWTLHVASSVIQRIEDEVQRHPTTETGGVLWGCVNEALGSIYALDLIEAPCDSERTPTSFVLGTSGLEAIMRSASLKTHGTLHSVGTWHSHLHAVGPSGADHEVARQIALDSSHANALLIWTPGGYWGLLADASAVHLAKREA